MADTEYTTTEEWRPIHGFDGYEVSNLGRIRSLKNYGGVACRILKFVLGNRGYFIVPLGSRPSRKAPLVHKLVAEAFHGPRPEGLHINHIDGNKRNNRADNLEYVTHQHNVDHAKENGLYWKRPGNALFTDEEARRIKALIKNCKNLSKLSREIGVHRSTLRNIKIGLYYQDV